MALAWVGKNTSDSQGIERWEKHAGKQTKTR